MNGLRRLRALSATFLLLISIFSYGQGSGVNVGGVSPDFSMKDSEGRPFRLSDLRGKIVLLEFWASWSGPCRFETPGIVSLFDEYRGKKSPRGEELVVVYVSLDVREGMWKKAIQSDKLENFVNVCDFAGLKGEAVVAYDAMRLPCSYVIDGSGKVRGKNLKGDGLKSLVGILMGK